MRFGPTEFFFKRGLAFNTSPPTKNCLFPFLFFILFIIVIPHPSYCLLKVFHFFYSCLQLCIFFLPPKAVIPLHNHPGMTVFIKLLLGSMHIKAYDWVDPSKSDDLVPSSERKCFFLSFQIPLLEVNIYINNEVLSGINALGRCTV